MRRPVSPTLAAAVAELHAELGNWHAVARHLGLEPGAIATLSAVARGVPGTLSPEREAELCRLLGVPHAVEHIVAVPSSGTATVFITAEAGHGELLIDSLQPGEVAMRAPRGARIIRPKPQAPAWVSSAADWLQERRRHVED